MYEVERNYPESITSRASWAELVRWERDGALDVEPSDWEQARDLEKSDRLAAEVGPRRPLSADAASHLMKASDVHVSDPVTTAVNRSFNGECNQSCLQHKTIV